MPQLASSSEPRLSTELPRSISRQSSRSPRSLAARTFATISRSASMRSIDRLDAPAVDPSLSTARAPPERKAATTSANSALPKLSAVGLTLNSITPNLSLSRYAQPLCGAILDGRYLLIGTTSGLDFLPLPEKGSLPVQHSGLKKRRETRKPLSLIKRTRFKQILVLNERSNVLVAIAGRNDHVRGACMHPHLAGDSSDTSVAAVYALNGIRAIIDKRITEMDPLQGYPISPAPSEKGKGRDNLPTGDPSNSSTNHFSAYHFPPSTQASESGGRMPSSSTSSRHLVSTRGATTAPIRVSQRTGPVNAPVVRSVPTVQAKHGPSTNSSTQPREFIAGRRSSTASIPRRPSRPDLGAVSPALSRRASLQSVDPRRSSTHGVVRRRSSVAPLTSLPASTASFPRLTPRTPLRPLSAEVSPTSSLAEFFRKTGPETAPPELNKLISISGRYSVDDEHEDARNAHFPLGRGMGEPPRLRRLSVTSAALFSPIDLSVTDDTQLRPLSPSTERSSSTTDSSGLPPASEPSHRLLMARSPVVDEEEAAATSRALLETLSEEPLHSRIPGAAASRRRKRWTFNGAAFSSAQSGQREVATPSPAQSPAIPSEDSGAPLAGRSPPGMTRIEVVSVVPTHAPVRRRSSQQTIQHDIKRRSVASLRSLGGANDKSAAERNAPAHAAHPANVSLERALRAVHSADLQSQAQLPLEYVKLARSRGARVLKAVETPRRTYLALLGGEEGDRVELFTGSKSISLSLNRTFVLPDTPRSIELQLQGDELVDIYLMYAETIFALEPSTVRVREVGVGREERRAQRQQDRHRDEQERLLRESPSFSGSASDLQDGGTASLPPGQTHAFEGEAAGAPDLDAASHPPTYAQPLGASASALRATVSSGANRDHRPVHDYTALQQLPFIPPVPASILAASWIIPPLYTDVVSDSGIASGPTDDAERLLPPVSLLGGAALRNNGPPGLFFCSKGASVSAIVTADGKSGKSSCFICPASGFALLTRSHFPQ